MERWKGSKEIIEETMKQSIGLDTYLFPLPAVVVGTYDKDGTPNMMSASWPGVVNSSPSLHEDTWWKWIMWAPNRAGKKINLKPPD